MQRVAVFFKLKPNQKEAYKKRHDEVWPSISALLTEAGIRNYTIWNHEDMLFGYYETDDPKKTYETLFSNSDFLRWRDDMEEYVYKEPQTGQKEWDMNLFFLHE